MQDGHRLEVDHVVVVFSERAHPADGQDGIRRIQGCRVARRDVVPCRSQAQRRIDARVEQVCLELLPLYARLSLTFVWMSYSTHLGVAFPLPFASPRCFVAAFFGVFDLLFWLMTRAGDAAGSREVDATGDARRNASSSLIGSGKNGMPLFTPSVRKRVDACRH